MLQEDGSFLIRGDADLEDVDTILNLSLGEDSALREFATLSGFLCMCAGEIPNTGDLVMSRGWCFEIENADDKKVLLVRVERLIGEDENGGEDTSNNPIRTLLRLNSDTETPDEVTSDGEDAPAVVRRTEEMIEQDLQRSREANIAEAQEIERIVQSGEKKISLMKNRTVGNGE